MSRLALLATALALPPLSFAAPPAEGMVESDAGRVEILNRPLRVGERIELPEGFLRVEEEGSEDERVGSFAVVSSELLVTAGAVPATATGGAGDPASGTEEERPCREERAAYLAELWRQSGIDVADPVALLEGLEAGATGPKAGFYWFALATDAFRPLAWSSDLRDRADALARCVRGR